MLNIWIIEERKNRPVHDPLVSILVFSNCGASLFLLLSAVELKFMLLFLTVNNQLLHLLFQFCMIGKRFQVSFLII